MLHAPLTHSRFTVCRHRARRLALWLGLGVPLVAACESDSLKPPPADQHDLYWRVDVNHHAVTLSTAPPYDTLTLTATPRNVLGNALAGLPTATYKSTDVQTVRVSAGGLLQAVAQNAQPVWVVATLSAGNLRHVDSVLVRVADLPTPPVLATFSVHPVPPDSAKTFSVSPGAQRQAVRLSVLPLRAADPNGTPFDSLVPGGIPVSFRSSDTTIAMIDGKGEITGLMPGTVTFYASTTAFGVSKADTAAYRIGWPIVGGVSITPTGFSPSEIKIAAGGIVSWEISGDTATVDVTFNDADVPYIGSADSWPAAYLFRYYGLFTIAEVCAIGHADCANGGNFGLAPPTIVALRAFPVPGTYEYRSVRLGTGRVIVVDER